MDTKFSSLLSPQHLNLLKTANAVLLYLPFLRIVSFKTYSIYFRNAW